MKSALVKRDSSCEDAPLFSGQVSAIATRKDMFFDLSRQVLAVHSDGLMVI